MRVVDTNLLVYAHRPESPDHDAYLAWFEDVRRSHEALGVPAVVRLGFLRVVTHPRVFRDPSPLAEALGFVERLRATPNVVDCEPGPRHWGIFADLGRRVDARGNLLPDAYLAALAMEKGATLCSADRGFGRFPDLRWEHPLDP